MKKEQIEIFNKGCYQGLSDREIAGKVAEEGFHPIRIADGPGATYHPHQHPETKLLAFLQGSMEVRVGGQTYHCESGDKLLIPGNVEHAANAGPKGCVFFWSEKIV